MTVIVAVIVGFLTGRMLWLAMRKSWSRMPLMRTNYQGVTLPTATGIVLSLSLLLIEAGRQVLGSLSIGDDPGLSGVRAAALVAVLSFTVLGLLDDLLGNNDAKGFGGHTKALARGELTSGMVKAIGGGTAALIASGLIIAGSAHAGFVALILDAAIIALAANFFNLLDLRPGRSGKVGIFAFVVIAVLARFDASLVPAAIVVGAAAALILDDLHERLMLGDTGANAMGAAVGVALATQVSGTGRIAVALVLLVLNLLSEVVSYSKLIDSFGPFKALDKIGRKSSSSSKTSKPKASAPQPPVDVRDQNPFETPAPRDRAPQPANSRLYGSDELFDLDGGNMSGAPETDDRREDDEMDLRDSLFTDEDHKHSGHPNGTSHRSDRI